MDEMDDGLWPARNVAENAYCPRLFYLMEGGTLRVFDGRGDTTANDKNHAAAVFDLGSGAFNTA